MAFDYKKEYKELYMPPAMPAFIDVPSCNYAAVCGKGNPNEENGEYKKAVGMLYAVAYNVKMSKLTGDAAEGYFDFVVPPLEGFWTFQGGEVDVCRKENFQWISAIRLPDFVTKEAFDKAVASASKKKKADLSAVEFFTVEEGLCVQCMHIGSYDSEKITMEKLKNFAESNCAAIDCGERRHHEIYLSDPRKVSADNLRTVLRIPVKRR